MSYCEEIMNYAYLSPECTLSIGRGIGIGSTRDEVMIAYESDVNVSQSNDDIVVIGRYHIGIILVMRDEVVNSIYIPTGGATEEYFLENLDLSKPPDDRWQ